MVDQEKAIDEGFRRKTGTDFAIVCNDGQNARTFYTHSDVLRRCQYFSAAMNLPFQEADQRRVELDVDPLAMRTILNWIYGDDSAVGEPEVAFPGGDDLSFARRNDDDRELDIFLGHCPSADASAFAMTPRFRRVVSSEDVQSIRYEDPSEAKSKFHCTELMHHVKVYALADRLTIFELREPAMDRIKELSNDCWNSPAIVPILDFVLNNTQSEDAMRMFFCKAIMDRLDMIYLEPAFVELNTKHGIILDTLAAAMVEHTRRQTDLYCAFEECRKNVPESPLHRCLRGVTRKGLSDVNQILPLQCKGCDIPGCLRKRRRMIWTGMDTDSDDSDEDSD